MWTRKLTLSLAFGSFSEPCLEVQVSSRVVVNQAHSRVWARLFVGLCQELDLASHSYELCCRKRWEMLGGSPCPRDLHQALLQGRHGCRRFRPPQGSATSPLHAHA